MILKEKILFSKQECNSIISYNETHITNWLMSDRKYHSQPIAYSLETNWLFDKLKDFVERETNIETRTIKKTIHFHKFTKGDWFGKHNDVRDNRLYAVGVLLNDNFEGGNFEISRYSVPKMPAGSLIVFPSFMMHRVSPIIEGIRNSIVCWCVGPKFK